MLSHKAANGIYRIIDANTNRLKEGLRVCEEIFRFIVEDRRITRLLKGIRHQADVLAAALACRNRRLAARNSARDTGRSLHTRPELKRSGVSDLFAANIQRVKESIRVLEEFSKLTDTKCALGFKELRYRVYEIEQRAAKAIGSRYR
ncbi:MAG TPA: thiamine-phosphate pyrophosphorylase [Candidatus Omnitrophota bacterium]|nr:thiamine-phosphate pyrophosphorylase [Candidatus Omnitrophota bacterium]